MRLGLFVARTALVAMVLLATAGCRKKPPPVGDSGPAARIVSLSPSTTETLFVIGAGNRVVGRSRYCDWPPEVLKLPQIGGYVDPSFEAILALRPDLVTGARGPAGGTCRSRVPRAARSSRRPQGRARR
jgi:iron complex transport system substrate-binding protein